MHFLLTVFGEHVEQQLDPYWENNSGLCLEEYLRFNDVEAEYRERFAKERFDLSGLARFNPARVAKLVRGVFRSFDAFMAEVYGPRDEKTGRYGDWWNPSSEFDFYEVGGRWADHLILHSAPAGVFGSGGGRVPGRADWARKADIDFRAMGAECRQRYLAAWGRLERDGQTADRWAKERHNIPETILTRQQLAAYSEKRSLHCAPDAVVVGGEWTGPWWAKDDLTEEAADRWDAQYSSLLRSTPDDTLVTVVDCHV
jgi:hypothetical protein